MNPPEGLRTLLNEIRATAIENNTLYGRTMERIDPTTNIGQWAAPLLNNQQVMNEFVPALLDRIVSTQINIKYFNSPLRSLEGTEMPLGATVQDIYTNPVKGRQFNPNDFAGLLAKYEPDVKVQYNTVNADWQYPVTVSEDNIRSAFVSWGTLYEFVQGIVAAVYNGFYIDDFRTTKGLIGAAYRENMVVVNTMTAPTDEATAKAMIRQARALYLNMQLPTTEYNAWNQIGGEGRAITTFTEANDIVIMIRNDILALVDVDVLAAAFNMDKANFIGRVYGVDNFSQYDDEGNLLFDGSNIFFAIGDRRWFRIKPQMQRFDQFYNANNTSWQYYLRVRKMYQYSYFANMVVFASEQPTVDAQTVSYNPTSLSLTAGTSATTSLVVTPASATTPITYQAKKGSSNSTDLTVTANGRNITVAASDSASGAYTVVATAGDLTATLNVTVTAATQPAKE